MARINQDQTEINFYPASPHVMFNNITTELNFYIRSYDSTVPIFQTVLDFIEIFGGVY